MQLLIPSLTLFMLALRDHLHATYGQNPVIAIVIEKLDSAFMSPV